jgi:hypothetical protein
MAKTFLDFWNELIGYAGEGLDPSLAQTLVQRAQKDILESRSWSFLIDEGSLNAPQLISAGSVTVAQFTNTVTCDATAKTALNAVTLSVPLGTRQFRTGVTSRIYNIDSYDSGTGVITLKEQFVDAPVTAGGYSVFKCYYEPPTPTDFIRFISVRDLTNGRPLRLGVQKKELDRRDPQRTSTEPPVCVSTYKTRADNVPLFELWPTPTSARGYVALYVKRGTVMEDDADTLPPSIPDELLMARAQYHLAKWAEMTKGRDETLKATDWRFIMAESLARYNELLLKAKKQDDEIFTQNVMYPRQLVSYPPSASWMQEHDWP